MENKILENAVDDISLIKNIIESTRKSFVGFSKIFILWGLLFGAFSFLQWMQTMNMELTEKIYMDNQYLVLLLPLILIVLATVIYRMVVKKQPLVGLERHLMKLWIMILFLQVMPTKVSISSLSDPNTTTNMTSIVTTTVTTTNNFSVVVFALGIALVMTSVLTGLSKLKYLGFGYFALAFMYGYLPMGGFMYSLGRLGYVVLPFTLLITGVYLKKHHERSEISGTQLNS